MAIRGTNCLLTEVCMPLVNPRRYPRLFPISSSSAIPGRIYPAGRLRSKPSISPFPSVLNLLPRFLLFRTLSPALYQRCRVHRNVFYYFFLTIWSLAPTTSRRKQNGGFRVATELREDALSSNSVKSWCREFTRHRVLYISAVNPLP